MAGADAKTVQGRLGHSTPVMTVNIHLHVSAGAPNRGRRRRWTRSSRPRRQRGRSGPGGHHRL